MEWYNNEGLDFSIGKNFIYSEDLNKNNIFDISNNPNSGSGLFQNISKQSSSYSDFNLIPQEIYHTNNNSNKAYTDEIISKSTDAYNLFSNLNLPLFNNIKSSKNQDYEGSNIFNDNKIKSIGKAGLLNYAFESEPSDAEKFFLDNKVEYSKFKLFHIKKAPKKSETEAIIPTIGMRMKLKKERIKMLLDKHRHKKSTSNTEDETNYKDNHSNNLNTTSNNYKDLNISNNTISSMSILKESKESNKIDNNNINNINNFNNFNNFNNINTISALESTNSKPKSSAFVLQNRLSAQLSRDRKKKEFETLKKYSEEMCEENKKLKNEIEKMENEMFLYKINNYCNRCGISKENINFQNNIPNNINDMMDENTSIIHNTEYLTTRQLQKKYSPEVSDLTVVARGTTNSCFKFGLFTSFLIVVCIIGSFFWTSFFNFEESIATATKGRILVNSIDLDNIPSGNKKAQENHVNFITNNISKKGFIENLMYSWYQPKESSQEELNTTKEDKVINITNKNNNISNISKIINSHNLNKNININLNKNANHNSNSINKSINESINENNENNNIFLGRKRKDTFIFSETCNDTEMIDLNPKNITEIITRSKDEKITEVCIKNQKFLWEAHNEEEELQSYLNSKKNKQNLLDITSMKKSNIKKKTIKVKSNTNTVKDELIIESKDFKTLLDKNSRLQGADIFLKSLDIENNLYYDINCKMFEISKVYKN